MTERIGDPFRLYDTPGVHRLLDAMARRAAALVDRDTPLTLVGILRRGVPLAQLLRERLVRDHGLPGPALLELKIERYSDDLRLLHPDTRLTEDPAHVALSLAGRTVLLVDDVLYHGNSLLRALAWLERKGPRAVRTALLVDRDVSVLPLRADVVGVRLDVAEGDVVECRVPPYEAELEIAVVRPRRTPHALS